MAKQDEIKGNGHNPNTDVLGLDVPGGVGSLPEIATISPQYHDPGFLVGASVDTGNPGSRILAMDKDLPTMLKALYVDDDEEALDFSAALAWCVRWNHKTSKDKHAGGNLDHHIEALKYRLALKCSRKGLYTHFYGEFANGLITTDSNGRGLSHIIAKDNKEKDNDNRNNKFSGKI